MSVDICTIHFICLLVQSWLRRGYTGEKSKKKARKKKVVHGKNIPFPLYDGPESMIPHQQMKPDKKGKTKKPNIPAFAQLIVLKSDTEPPVGE